jgi:hypothetical protein
MLKFMRRGRAFLGGGKRARNAFVLFRTPSLLALPSLARINNVGTEPSRKWLLDAVHCPLACLHLHPLSLPLARPAGYFSPPSSLLLPNPQPAGGHLQHLTLGWASQEALGIFS